MIDKRKRNRNTEHQKKHLNKELEKIRAYKAIFATEHGKVVYEDLAIFCFYNACTFAPKTEKNIPYNSHEMALREGQRNTYLYIKRKIETDETKLIEALSVLGNG